MMEKTKAYYWKKTGVIVLRVLILSVDGLATLLDDQYHL